MRNQPTVGRHLEAKIHNNPKSFLKWKFEIMERYLDDRPPISCLVIWFTDLISFRVIFLDRKTNLILQKNLWELLFQNFFEQFHKFNFYGRNGK